MNIDGIYMNKSGLSSNMLINQFIKSSMNDLISPINNRNSTTRTHLLYWQLDPKGSYKIRNTKHHQHQR